MANHAPKADDDPQSGPAAAASEHEGPRFKIPLPGGRVARLPLEVLERYVDETATSAHGSKLAPPAEAGGNPSELLSSDSGESQTIHAGDGMITINIYAGSGAVQIQRSADDDSHDDVVAHSMAVDASTGVGDWHTDWEFGECEYTDEAGFPQRLQAWHRHPFGTEYTELYEA